MDLLGFVLQAIREAIREDRPDWETLLEHLGPNKAADLEAWADGLPETDKETVKAIARSPELMARVNAPFLTHPSLVDDPELLRLLVDVATLRGVEQVEGVLRVNGLWHPDAMKAIARSLAAPRRTAATTNPDPKSERSEYVAAALHITGSASRVPGRALDRKWPRIEDVIATWLRHRSRRHPARR